MKKSLKMLGSCFKYAGLMLGASAALGLGYLQYVNFQIGPIDINKDIVVKHYIEVEKMEQSQAKKMYYWVIYDLALMRVLTYHTYSSYCDKLCRRIVAPLLKQYEQKDLLNKITSLSHNSDQKKNKTLYKEVCVVRQANMENLALNQYIIKEIRKQQYLMKTRELLGLQSKTLQKVNTIYRFVCQTGVTVKDAQVLEYVSNLPYLEKRLPGDLMHKIMFI